MGDCESEVKKEVSMVFLLLTDKKFCLEILGTEGEGICWRW